MVSKVGGPPGGMPPGAGAQGSAEEDSAIYSQLKKFINVIVSAQRAEKKANERDAKQTGNSGLAARLKESVFADKDRFAFSFFLLCNKGR